MASTSGPYDVGDLPMLWRTKLHWDIVVRSGDKVELPAHRSVLTRSPWMACTLEMQRNSTTEMKYLQLEERSAVVQPLIAFCYGVQLPMFQPGPKTEDQFRILIDLYHANHWKYQISKLEYVCEKALADLGDGADGNAQPKETVPAVGVASPGEVQVVHEDRRIVSTPENSSINPMRGRLTLEDHHQALRDNGHESRLDSLASATSLESEPRSRAIPIPNMPQMARLRDRSPGGGPYELSRLYYEILEMLGPLGLPSPMLYGDLPGLRPTIEPLRASFNPNSRDSDTPRGMSMSPLLDPTSPPEDTLHLIPGPLRPRPKPKPKETSSGLHGPRPLPPVHWSKRSMTIQDMETRTIMERPSNASLKEGMFSSLRDATRRAFNKSKH